MTFGRRTIFLAALSFSLFSAPLGAQAPAANLTAERLEKRVDAYYNALHSLRVRFSETYDGMGVHRAESGALLLRKPGKMLWSYAEPAGKLFLLDGRYGWFYSPGDAQVQRVPASRLDDLRSPLRLLLGRTQLGKELQDLTLSAGAAGLELSGVPNGMRERVASVRLGVTPDGIIHSIIVTEADGARTTFAFTDSEPNAPAPESDFIFRPPAGVPVVDGLPPV